MDTTDIVGFSALIASWMALSGGIWKLSEKLEKVVATPAKDQVTIWLRSTEPGVWLKGIGGTFIQSFDLVFGDKHFSWKCFLRSCVASWLAVGQMIIVWAVIRPTEVVAAFEELEILLFFLCYPIMSAIVNFIPDYISLLETRFAISFSETSKNISIFTIILLDLILTTAIALIAMVILAAIQGQDVYDVVLIAIELKAQSQGKLAVGVLFYSTFLTSSWLWIHSISGLMINLGSRTNKASRFFLRNLDIDEKPFLSLGVISIVIISCFYVLLTPIIIFIQYA